MSKPALFVGSSSEGLEFARAVRALLDEDAEVTLWKEGLFDVGSTFIDSLIKALPRFDFAALILTGDDLLTSREITTLGPRDNVLFELGLFMGRLGRERTFVVRARSDHIKIPSDLAGLTTATYDWASCGWQPSSCSRAGMRQHPQDDSYARVFGDEDERSDPCRPGGTGPSRCRPTDNLAILTTEL